jgi:hypothetical protein
MDKRTNESEQQTMERIWREVQTKTGTQTHLGVGPLQGFDLFFMGLINADGSINPNAAINPREGIRYTPGFSKLFTDSQIAGTLAHELGHFAGGFKHGHASEVAADVWAAKHGYGPQLLDTLHWFAAKDPEGAKAEDSDHPVVGKRFAAINKVIESQQHQTNRSKAKAA